MTNIQASLLNCVNLLNEYEFITDEKAYKLSTQVKKGDKQAYDVVSILLDSHFIKR